MALLHIGGAFNDNSTFAMHMNHAVGGNWIMSASVFGTAYNTAERHVGHNAIWWGDAQGFKQRFRGRSVGFTRNFKSATDRNIPIPVKTAVVDRLARFSFVEFEVPLEQSKARFSWSELEVPTPAKGRISFGELELPNPNAVARFSFAEFEVPDLGGGSGDRVRNFDYHKWNEDV